MYDKEYYKGWYEKNKQKARDYYQKNKAHILQVHQAWAKKNVDTGVPSGGDMVDGLGSRILTSIKNIMHVIEKRFFIKRKFITDRGRA